MSTELTRVATLYAAEGYLSLGDIRAIVKATADYPDISVVEAGFREDNSAVRFDTFNIESTLEDVEIGGEQ